MMIEVMNCRVAKITNHQSCANGRSDHESGGPPQRAEYGYRPDGDTEPSWCTHERLRHGVVGVMHLLEEWDIVKQHSMKKIFYKGPCGDPAQRK